MFFIHIYRRRKMKFREKEKILRQIEEKSYEEELDENAEELEEQTDEY